MSLTFVYFSDTGKVLADIIEKHAPAVLKEIKYEKIVVTKEIATIDATTNVYLCITTDDKNKIDEISDAANLLLSLEGIEYIYVLLLGLDMRDFNSLNKKCTLRYFSRDTLWTIYLALSNMNATIREVPYSEYENNQNLLHQQFDQAYSAINTDMLTLIKKISDRASKNHRKANKVNHYSDYLERKLKRMEDANDDATDVIFMMLKNNEETTEYFNMTKKHAKISYFLSISACCIGLLFLIVSAVLVVFYSNHEPAIITLISGAISELIACTVLWVHNKSALQLNHYYDALHQNEQFLSAINLIERIDEANRDAAYSKLVELQMLRTESSQPKSSV